MNKTQVKKKIMTATKFNHVCNSMLFSKSFNFTLLALDRNIATKKALVNKAEDRKKIETRIRQVTKGSHPTDDGIFRYFIVGVCCLYAAKTIQDPNSF